MTKWNEMKMEEHPDGFRLILSFLSLNLFLFPRISKSWEQILPSCVCLDVGRVDLYQARNDKNNLDLMLLENLIFLTICLCLLRINA